ncbi:putative DNA-binding protein [Ureaplasma urealyticum]|uniref:putative DNA-binding protein n=1 Tax=Ureaplasma urealyticum TaxID=2130 RepID=UPI001F60B051|nr:putative DNA-binding protein [Ureaplasma urealyticum]UNT66366.1 putative DNA-binding protein [Ureaplasma urealyticum]
MLSNNKRWYLIALYDIYQKLLTNKQCEYFNLHYFEDLSFSEIAELKKVSKSAVSDSLNKVCEQLTKYEQALLIYEKNKKRNDLYDLINDSELVKKLRAI